MIGIVLVTMAAWLRNSFPRWSIWWDRKPHLRAVCIGPEDDIEPPARNRGRRKIGGCGRGVIIATDMFGGTPCNLALTCWSGGKIEVLAGANLPSLIKLIDIRTKLPLEQAVKEAIEAGRK